METYARRRLERNVLSTLLTNKGRDDVVVLLDRAVGARRKGREGRHHDLRHRSRRWGSNYLNWRRSRPHTSARSIGACLCGGNHFSATSAMVINAPARAAERVELVHHEELRLFTFEHLAAACRRSKFHLGRVVAEKRIDSHAGSRAVVRRRRAAKDDHVGDLRRTNHTKAPHVE